MEASSLAFPTSSRDGHVSEEPHDEGGALVGELQEARPAQIVLLEQLLCLCDPQQLLEHLHLLRCSSSLLLIGKQLELSYYLLTSSQKNYCSHTSVCAWSFHSFDIRRAAFRASVRLDSVWGVHV